jgi:ribosomal protein S18 acetylase RimI-like enzyme
VAAQLFDPAAVRARGTLITVRGTARGPLLGMIILVPPGGAASQIAGDTEAEVHLLAVAPEARGRGLGRRLVETVVALARASGWRRLVLSTQESMREAQRLYAQAGFVRVPERDWTRGERRFLAYAMDAGG